MDPGPVFDRLERKYRGGAKDADSGSPENETGVRQDLRRIIDAVVVPLNSG